MSEEIVKAAAGTMVEMNLLKEELEAAGINGRVVGDDLSTGLGSTLPGSVELWVNCADADRAAKLIERSQWRDRKHPPFPHPESDRKPDRSEGTHHASQRRPGH